MQKDFALMSKLLACYLAAIVHDYEHRGVNNDFLIKTSDPLALLYNDVSPMENHHVASAFLLMREEPYAFFPRASKRVRLLTVKVRRSMSGLVVTLSRTQPVFCSLPLQTCS